MKKIINILGVLAFVFVFYSCEKNEFQYATTELSKDNAQVQLHYFVPIPNVTANYITRVDFNDVLYHNTNFAVYAGIPSGSVGKFFSVPAGKISLKCFKVGRFPLEGFTGDKKYVKDTVVVSGVQYLNVDTLLYSKEINLSSNKRYNVFITSLTADPIVVEHPDPYLKGVSKVDTLAYFCLGNFFFDADGVTPFGTLQLQLRSRDKDPAINDYTYENIGDPVPFGTISKWNWLKLKLPKNPDGSWTIDSGKDTRYFKIVKDNGNGTYTDLPYWTSTTKQAPFTDYWNWYYGRRYFWFLGGKAGTRTTQIYSSGLWTLM